MLVKRVSDGASFLDEAGGLLLADEARHNLLLGLAATLRDSPSRYSEFLLRLVEHDGRALAAALRTPPFNAVVAGPDPEALGALAAALHGEGHELPGVTAALPEATHFADGWAAASGQRVRERMRQQIYALSTVRPVRGVPGSSRHATREDADLLIPWIRAFGAEARHHASAPGEDAGKVVAARFDGPGGFAIWEDDGAPVSLAGWGARTPNGVRIGPVYTPPEHRGRGYASALTAAVSAEQLAAGRRFCFLYTDAANPTANKIYRAIGYEHVCESVELAFEPA